MTALITGASKGIGYAIAKRLASEGIDLILNARNTIELESVKSELLEVNPAIKVSCCAADLSDKDKVSILANYVTDNFQSLDILINNAGVFLSGEIQTADEGLLERMMNTNLYSAFHLTRALIPLLKSNTVSNIFNICSIAGLQPYKGGSLYCISKFAMNGFSLCLRNELKNDGVKVCTIYPGATWSDSWKGADLDESRIMQASDIAEAISAVLKLSPSAVIEEIVIRPQLGDL